MITRTENNVVEHMLESAYLSKIQEYEKELAQRRLLVFLAKLGIKSAQKLVPFGEFETVDMLEFVGK